MNLPTVSIIIIAYDGTSDLEKSIESALAQTYSNIEILVVVSKLVQGINTKGIVNLYGERVKLITIPSSDLAELINQAVSSVKGKFFSWLLQGDTYAPDRIMRLIQNGSAANTVVLSNWLILNKNGRKVYSSKVADTLKKFPRSYLAFAINDQLNTRSMLFPTDIFVKAGLFQGSLPPHYDYTMLRRLIDAGIKFNIVDDSFLSCNAESNFEFYINRNTEQDFDFIHSDCIKDLSYNDIKEFYGSKEGVINAYKKFLDAGYPRTAAFLIEKFIRGQIESNGLEVAALALVNVLSNLSEEKMATSSTRLIAKTMKPSSRKKIMFSSAHWLTGGMERVIATLFEELKKDYEVFLITPYDSRVSKIDIPNYVVNIKIADELFVKHFDSIVLSYALLLDIDVVIGFINLFNKQQNVYNLCKGTKIKTIASNHEYYFYPYKSSCHYNIVEKRLSAFKKCDAIVWPNNFNAALCGLYTNKNYLIGNPNKFQIKKIIRKNDKKIILAVGRFNDYVKRIDRIFECFSLVLKDTPEAKLVIVGQCNIDAQVSPNSKTTIREFINELAIPKSSINFTGEVNNVEHYYSQASVLILTSNSEGFGMVVNEAACFGVPAVCNYIPGIEDIITDGKNGYITKQGDVRKMALRITEILKNDSLHKKLSSNARSKVKNYDSRQIGLKWKYLISILTTVEDRRERDKLLSAKLGYVIQDKNIFVQVLASEINEIFCHTVAEVNKLKVNSNAIMMLSSVMVLPQKLKANISYEGLPKTIAKIFTRSFKIVKKRMFV